MRELIERLEQEGRPARLDEGVIRTVLDKARLWLIGNPDVESHTEETIRAMMSAMHATETALKFLHSFGNEYGAALGDAVLFLATQRKDPMMAAQILRKLPKKLTPYNDWKVIEKQYGAILRDIGNLWEFWYRRAERETKDLARQAKEKGFTIERIRI